MIIIRRQTRVGLVAALALVGTAPIARAQGFGLRAPDRNEIPPLHPGAPRRGARTGILRLVRHDMQLAIRHPVAETVVTQEFDNPHDANLEAFFSYPVPHGATVTGLALWVGGLRREARMLERQRAREIYHGIVSEKRDPALLQQSDGGFRIRIFPVLARSRQRVELRFVEPVERDADGSYRVTLRRPPGSTVDVLRLGVDLQTGFAPAWAGLEGYPGHELRRVAQGYQLALPRRGQPFTRSIELRYRPAGPVVRAQVAATVAGDRRLFVAELPAASRSAWAAGRLALLVDVSASMAPHLAGARRLARELAEHLGPRDRLSLVPFGLLPRRTIPPAAVDRSLCRRITAALEQVEVEGGTAFSPAFDEAMGSGATHLVLVTDGGSRYHQAELEHLLRLVFEQEDVTVSVVALGEVVNERSLADLAQATGGVFQRQVEQPAELAARLAGHRPRRGVRVTGKKGEAHLLGVGGGGALVAGMVPAAHAGPVQLAVGGQRITVATAGAVPCRGASALFGAAAIERRMREIKAFGETEPLRSEVVRLSKSHRVLSEYTALLATETDADYDRPTSGAKWRRPPPPAIADDLPRLSSTPEPHEWALIGLALVGLLWARRRGWLGAGAG